MGFQSVGVAGLLRPYWKLCLGAVIAMLLASAADLLEPWPLKIVLDYVIGSKTPPRWLAGLPLLGVAVSAVIVVALVGAVSSYWEKYSSTTIGKRVGYDLRHVLYHHVQRLSLSFYDNRPTGDILVRLTSDISSVEDVISNAVLGIVVDVVTLAGMLAVMLILDWRFSLIGLSITPPLFFIAHRFVRRIKETARDVRRQESELASVVQESIASVRVIKAFAREELEERRMDRQSLAGVEAALRARSVKATLTPLVDLVIAGGTCVVLLAGAHLVFSGTMTAGSLVVYVLYLGKMYKPIKDLSKTTDTVSKAAVAFERIRELLAMERQVSDRPGARPATHLTGRIVFDHVTFAYSADQPVLDDVCLEIAPGQRAALVGQTGAGKSTLIALLPRLYDANSGRITIDGRDVRDYTLRSLREQISVVLQDSVLFRGSIAQNIAYGRPDASAEDILRVSRLARVDDFVARLPRGYETMVAERGHSLSGGQRQRIAIARALIRDAPILLLDEPSAALDAESEDLIFQGLAELLKRRTSLTIAHRLATVRNADVIFVLHRGRIVETGTHGELLARDGRYAHYYRIQFRSTNAVSA